MSVSPNTKKIAEPSEIDIPGLIDQVSLSETVTSRSPASNALSARAMFAELGSIAPSIPMKNVCPKGMLNPMAPIMDGYRRVILHGIPPDFHFLSIAVFVTLIILILSYRFFKRVEMNFADIV